MQIREHVEYNQQNYGNMLGEYHLIAWQFQVV